MLIVSERRYQQARHLVYGVVLARRPWARQPQYIGLVHMHVMNQP